MAEKKPKPKKSEPEPERVKFDGDWENLAERVVKQPGGKAPPREAKPRKEKGQGCKHPKLRKERMFGQQTGDYICAHCRAVLSPAEVTELGLAP